MPVAVAIIGWLYIAVGAIGFAYHITEFRALSPFPYQLLGVELVRLTAVVAGIYILRGRNWARWVALAWIAFHVVVSALHTLPELAIHSLFCAIIAWVLFRPSAGGYFRAGGSARGAGSGAGS